MIVVADTSAVLALLDVRAREHGVLRAEYERGAAGWLLPWATLPEIDHLTAARLGPQTARAFRADVAAGRFRVEWNGRLDLERATEIEAQHPGLRLGLVDAVVMAQAERLGAGAIATLDLRDFGAVTLRNSPALWPRDLR